MAKQTATLSGWAIAQVPGGEGYWLLGVVSGHPHIQDTTVVHTSTLLKIDFETMKAETLNTIYSLV